MLTAIFFVNSSQTFICVPDVQSTYKNTLIILPYVFWPLTTSTYFVLLKPFNYQNVQLIQDILAMTFGFFYSFYTF